MIYKTIPKKDKIATKAPNTVKNLLIFLLSFLKYTLVVITTMMISKIIALVTIRKLIKSK
ncbi:hypothetical protein BKH41_08855 [Helicobacter sp. 12S02232-10]|nr:hypothetical protein BKH41_08855 [Helicobacter sp. 12S02232-10]